MEPNAGRNLDELEMRAWRAVVVGSGRLINTLDEELMAQSGLSLAEYEVLSYLSEVPDSRLRMAQLAEGVVVSRSGLTRRVDGLVSQGLVKRSACPSDRRGMFAELTAAGRRRLEEAAPLHRAGVRQHLLDQLNREQLQVLAEALGVVAELLGGPLAPPRSNEPTIRHGEPKSLSGQLLSKESFQPTS